MYGPHLEAGARSPQKESAATMVNLEQKIPGTGETGLRPPMAIQGAGPFLCRVQNLTYPNRAKSCFSRDLSQAVVRELDLIRPGVMTRWDIMGAAQGLAGEESGHPPACP